MGRVGGWQRHGWVPDQHGAWAMLVVPWAGPLASASRAVRPGLVGAGEIAASAALTTVLLLAAG